VITLAEQIQAVWEAQDAPVIEAAEYRRMMMALRPDSGPWKQNAARAEAADRQRLALIAAHATLRDLAAGIANAWVNAQPGGGGPGARP
jgi:hypothetical protein